MQQEKLKIAEERARFTELLASNPNFFGNQPDSEFPVVKALKLDTRFEEVHCLGFHPASNRLEATVMIKQSSGYGGKACPASTEFVRFYINYGGGWEDVGVAAFGAHDVPTDKDCAKQIEKPLCYTVSHRLEPKRDFCFKPVLPRIRAILSWQQMPPADTPNWPPVWGNVLECPIQIQPEDWKLEGIFEIAKPQVELPFELASVQDQPLNLPQPPALDLAAKAELYKKAKFKVEPHRFGFEELAAVTEKTIDPEALMVQIAQWKEVGLEFTAAAEALAETKEDTRYEELDCLGLDPNLEQVIATFRIKRPSGYSGNLCQQGSQEYISFWADWDDVCEWRPLGTVQIAVHDIASIPEEGLCYSVFMPVDLTHHRQPCEEPKVGRLRAVLSWNTPPSKDPNEPPRWGNGIETHVEIPAGEGIPEGEVKPIFHRLGGIRAYDIDNANGLTLPTATFDNGFAADGSGRPCPFAGRVVITGPPFVGHSYRLRVRRVGDPMWTSLVNTFWVEPLVGLKYLKGPVVPGGEYFDYEALANNPDLVLGWWQTGGDEAWDVRLDIQGEPGFVEQRIQLKNSPVEDARIHIDAGGDCGKFRVGDTLTGAFVARDPYLSHYSLGTLPFATPAGQLAPSGGAVNTPAAPAGPTSPPPGGAAWSLNTNNMPSCGYVLRLYVRDRAIVNSTSSRHDRSASVGFCLLGDE